MIQLMFEIVKLLNASIDNKFLSTDSTLNIMLNLVQGQ